MKTSEINQAPPITQLEFDEADFPKADMSTTKTTENSPLPYWPKFKITTFNSGSGKYEIRIVDRATAIQEMRNSAKPEYKKYAEADVENIASGQVVAIGTEPRFSAYTYEDHLRGLAPQFVAALEDWIETVQTVDGGVYGCSIDKTREILARARQ